MATFTSVSGGNWNNGATWGKTSPGVKGTDWPGLAGDVVNIGTTGSQSHEVIYNVSETNELGAVIIGAASGAGASRLTFSTAMTTLMTLGHVDITVQTTGELRVGTLGAIVPYNYTASLVWDTTSDNVKGISVSAGGKINIYGDPSYFGSVYQARLVSQVTIPASGSVTITVVGDFTTKWVTGQELVVHKGGTYASQINDCCRLAIASTPTANGANTDIACTVTERPAALTCLVGADVFNVSRNVLLYKLGYNATLGNYNSTSPARPRLANANVTGTNNIKIHDAVAAGWYTFLTGIGVDFNGVTRNGIYSLSALYMASIDGISLSNSVGYYNMYNSFVAGRCICCGSGSSGFNSVFTGDFIGTGAGSTSIGGYRNIYTGNIYSCYGVNYQAIDCKVMGGAIGYDRNGVAKANGAYGFAFVGGSWLTLSNVKTDTPPTFYSGGRNIATCQGRMGFEHYGQVANAHHLADNWGDLDKVSSGWTSTPPSGAANCLKTATTQNALAAPAFLDIIPQGLFRVWQKAGTVVYKVYIQAPTGNNSDYAAADLVLYADYFSVASPLTIATANSSGGIARADAWTQSLTVSVTSAAAGWVTLYLRLFKYYAATDVFYVDPGIWAGGNILLGDWSMGELVYPGPSNFGGGGNPALLPLGVMEAVQ